MSAAAAASLGNRRKPPNSDNKSRMGSSGIKASDPSYLCRVECHPLSKEKLGEINNPNVAAIVELCIPASYYGTVSPQKFFDLKCSGHEDNANRVRQLLIILGYLVNMLGAERKRPRVEEGGAPNEMEIYFNKNTATVTFECVPHYMSPTRIVAFRVRVVEYGTEVSSMMSDLAELIKRNDNDAAARLRVSTGGNGFRGGGRNGGGRSTSPPYWHNHVTLAQWHDLCRFYLGPYRMNQLQQVCSDTKNIRDERCVFNLSTVFSVEHSLDMCRNLDADPRFCDPAIYHPDAGTQHARFGFADARKVWVLSAVDLDPLRMPYRLMPMVRPDMRKYAAAMREFEKLHGPGSATSFDVLCNATASNELSHDIRGLTQRVQQELADLRCEFGDSPEFFARRRERQVTQWTPDMSSIFSATAGDNAAHSIIAIADWQDAFVVENETMCIPHVQACSNLTAFDDKLAQMMSAYHTILTVASTHTQCLLYMLSGLHVYARVDLNPHQLALGDPSRGKSFGFKLVEDMLIPGTVRMVTYFTPKALTAKGKANDCQIMIFEDSPASILGVQQGRSDISSDMVNMVKQFLTSMFVAVMTVRFDESGERIHEYISAECSCVCMFALNEPTSKFPDAILSRVHVAIYDSTDAAEDELQEGRHSMQDKAMRAAMPVVKETRADLRLYWQRTQALVARLFYSIAAGIIQPINLEFVNLFFCMVCAHAQRKFGINMYNQRKWERWIAIVRVLVLMRVINTVWDSPLCPFRDESHSDIHFLYAEKHLYGMLTDGIKAFGLLSAGWQDNTRTKVLQALKRHFFPQADQKYEHVRSVAVYDNEETIRRNEPVAPVNFTMPANLNRLTAVQQEMMKRDEVRQYVEEYTQWSTSLNSEKNWAYDQCFYGPVLPELRTNRNVPSTAELVHHLSTHLLSKMHPKPLAAEVEAVLTSMTRDIQPVTRRVRRKRGGGEPDEIVHQTVHRPVLEIDQDSVRLNLESAAKACNSNPLFDAVSDVARALVHRNPDKRQVPREMVWLYGETEKSTPYKWKTLPVGEWAHESANRSDDHIARVSNPNFFDPGLVKLTGNFLASILGGADRAHNNRMFKLFQGKNAVTDVDINPDRFAALVHSQDLGLCQEDQEERPSMYTGDTDAQIREHWREFGEAMHLYPDVLMNMDHESWKQHLEHSRLSDPRAFLLSTREALLREQQAQRRPLQPLPRTAADLALYADAAAASQQQRTREPVGMEIDDFDHLVLNEPGSRKRRNSNSHTMMDTYPIEGHLSHSAKRRGAAVAAH
jgi:hypothetical protein